MAPTNASPKASTSAASSKKRSAPAPAAPPADDRFAAFDSLSASDSEERPTESASSPKSFPRQSAPSHSLPAHLLPSALSGKSKKQPGLIYLSRIPPGMGPSKVKHLLSAYGEVGRVYLARADPDPPAAQSSKKGRHQAEKHKEHKFAEGWVEFEDKRVARSVAEMLNAQTIGGKKGTRHRDDVWTMKYLPRFRWDMLSEQVALERATQTSLLRFHLQHSRTEQESYLSAVEKARVGRKIEEKAAGRASGAEGDGKKRKAAEGEGEAGEKKEKKKGRTYRQREPIAAGGAGAGKGEDGEGKGKGGTKKQLDDVLGRLF